MRNVEDTRGERRPGPGTENGEESTELWSRELEHGIVPGNGVGRPANSKNHRRNCIRKMISEAIIVIKGREETEVSSE